MPCTTMFSWIHSPSTSSCLTSAQELSLSVDAPVRCKTPSWIPRYFPREPIRIGEIAGIASPGSLASGLDNLRASGRGASHQGFHLALFSNVVRQGHGCSSECSRIGLEIRGELLAEKQCKHHSAGLEEDDLLVLEYRLPTEAIDIEFLRSLKMFNSKGHNTDALVHGLGFSIRKRRHR